jgi:murein L,D-transpeptidase YafK
MIRNLRLVLLGLILLALAACGGMFSGSYFGPEVTSVVVQKADRKMYLFHNNKVLKVYPIELGTAPVGPKQFEGDGKTPEGLYYIGYRNGHSQFHLSLQITYPNAADVAYAKANGKKPGGDIFIHGQSPYSRGKQDWTVGCIAVTNAQMDVIYAMVQPGTPIWIKP